MIGLFFYMENLSNMAQPTEGWSIPIEVLDNGPRDYRLLDIMERPDKEGVLITFISEQGIELYETNWFGQIERNLSIEEDISDVRVLDVGYDENSYKLYISDRKVLESYEIHMESFTLGEKTLVSENSEQFSVWENLVIVGDDDLTNILDGDEILASFDGYDDLKRVRLRVSQDKIIAIMDTVKGSSLISIDDGVIKTQDLISPLEESSLGYLQDIYLKDGVITVLSSKHHIGENFPTSFGMWQLDEDLEVIKHEFWYHNRTSHRPIITNVDGNKVEYLLGLLTRQDENRQAVMQQPRLQEGTFTNILLFTMEDNSLIDYQRLSTTREYPIGYEYFQTDYGELIVWADRLGDNSSIRLAGMGQQWIEHANAEYSVDYFQIGSEVLMSFVASLIWGIIFAGIDLLDYILPIIIFLIIVAIFNGKSNLDRGKKELFSFLIVAVFASGFKFYVSAIANDGLSAYGQIYPYILANDLVLGTISIITSMSSLFLVNLWYNSNKDLGGRIHIMMYLGFEIYFYLFTIMVYVVSAMSKMNLMI